MNEKSPPLYAKTTLQIRHPESALEFQTGKFAFAFAARALEKFHAIVFWK